MPTTVRFLGPDSVKVDSKEKVPADVKGTKMKETKIKVKKANPKDDAKDKVKKPVKTGGKMKKA